MGGSYWQCRHHIKKKKNRALFFLYFFCFNLYQTFGSDPLPVSSEDNPPGLRSVVHPTRSASRRQSPVRREGGKGGVRRDDRDVVPSKRKKKKKKKEYRYLFLLSIAAAHPYIYPFILFGGLFVVGILHSTHSVGLPLSCILYEKNKEHRRSIDRVRWSLRWLAHTLRRFPCTWVFRRRREKNIFSSLFYLTRLTSSPRAL